MKDNIDKLIEDAAQRYRTPPETPRHEIWARVRERRQRRPFWRRKIAPAWLWMPAAAAAAVLAGIAIGRLSVAPPNVQPVLTEGPAPTESLPPAPAEDLYRLVANEYFSKTEVLLTEFRSSRGDGRLSSWAQELLVETRLLLDSPAANDAEVRSLLRDLELVLAQIVQARDRPRAKERQWTTDGLDERAVLVRLRMMVPARPWGA